MQMVVLCVYTLIFDKQICKNTFLDRVFYFVIYVIVYFDKIFMLMFSATHMFHRLFGYI